MYSFVMALLQVLIDFVYYLIPRNTPSVDKLKNAKIVAHRGWHDDDQYLENTLNGFDKALDNNLWGIEFDVRWTKDLVPIIAHDEDCLRVWNSSLIISETNFSQLRQSIPEIPTLAEVVNLYGKKIHLFIELKEEHFPEVEKQKQILKDSLSSLDPIEDFHIIAVKPSPLQVFNLFDPACYLAVAISNPFEMSHLALTHNYGGLLGHYVLCDDAILAKHHAVKQKVGTGYCRTANCLKREVQRDVDWIMTNHPWILLNFIESFD